MQRLNYHMSRLMGKPTICIGENKDADQLRGYREADQRLCFRYTDSTIPPLQNFKLLACFCACTGRFVSDLFGNHIVGFPTRWLIYMCSIRTYIFCMFFLHSWKTNSTVSASRSPTNLHSMSKFTLKIRKLKFLDYVHS